jgi:hypothetical protein
MSKCILIAQARAELKTAMFRHLGPNEYQTLDFSPLKCRCVEIKPPPRNHVFLLNLNFKTNGSHRNKYRFFNPIDFIDCSSIQSACFTSIQTVFRDSFYIAFALVV